MKSRTLCFLIVVLVLLALPAQAAISDSMFGKSTMDRAQIKAEGIARDPGVLSLVDKTASVDGKVKITIDKIWNDEGKVCVKYTASDKNGEYAVINPTCIVNPPVMVQTGTRAAVQGTPAGEQDLRILTENPKDALLQVLTQNALSRPRGAAINEGSDPTLIIYAANDGRMFRGSALSETFTEIRTGAGVNGGQTLNPSVVIQPNETPDRYSQLNRMAFTFDTRPIMESSTVTAATVSLWGVSKGREPLPFLDANNALAMVSFNPNNKMEFTGADYAYTNWGETDLAPNISYETFKIGDYNHFTLYDPANVVKEGYSTYGFRMSYDAYNYNIPYAWYDHSYYVSGVTTGGTAQDPYLTVDYTVPPEEGLSLDVDLGKTYTSKKMNVEKIHAIDIWNLSLSESRVLSTAGDNSDIQTLHNPVFNTLTRNFKSMTGTYNTVTVTVNGDNPSTVDWTGLPYYTFYTKPVFPTIRQKIPDREGNPLLSKFNESWDETTAADRRGLWLASDDMNMYKTGGILNINTTNYIYTNVGTFIPSDYDPDDFTYTLLQNLLAVDDFTSSATQAALLGDAHPEMKAGTGKYFLSTVRHDEPQRTTNVYSVYPVTALKAATPLGWNNGTSYLADEYTYFKGTGTPVTLGFDASSTNPDLAGIRNITYLIINRTVSYDITMDIDTDMLAKNADTRWQNSLSGGQVIDLLRKGLANDAGLPFDYTIAASGVSVPAPSTAWSTIAMTPGYGISGHDTAAVVTVPGAALESLDFGSYDIYLMGTNSDDDIVALDQKQVVVMPVTSQVGVWRDLGNGAGVFYLWDTNPGVTTPIYYGLSTDTPLVGDWTGTGTDTVGVWRGLDSGAGVFYLRESPTVTTPVYYGLSTDTPLVGDWTGTGADTVGVWRGLDSGAGVFYLRESPSTTTTIYYGLSTDTPFVWNDTGISKVGVWRDLGNGAGVFYLRNSDTVTTPIYYGLSSDTPFAGVESGTIGVWRGLGSGAGVFYLRQSPSVTTATYFGLSTDTPIIGKWS